MANISSAPYPVLTSLLTKVSKQSYNWWLSNGYVGAGPDSWAVTPDHSFYLINSNNFYFFGIAYIINNNNDYGSVVQPAITTKAAGPKTDIIVGRKDWLEINRELLLVPPGFNLVII